MVVAVALNPAAAEFVPGPPKSFLAAAAKGIKRKGRKVPATRQAVPIVVDKSSSLSSCYFEDESRTSSNDSKDEGGPLQRGPSSLTSSSSSDLLPCRPSFKSVQQLKVHAPGCACQRLSRAREELGDDSGYLVTSRDARTPDVHFGAAFGFNSAHADDDAARREAEKALAEAIQNSEMIAESHKLSCAACLLDGHWRNGAVCLFGNRDDVVDLCERSNALEDKQHKYVKVQNLNEDSVLNSGHPQKEDDKSPTVSVSDEDDYDFVLVRCVAIRIQQLKDALGAYDEENKADVVLPFKNAKGVVEQRRVIVEVKHHVVEALQIVDIQPEDSTAVEYALCLTYVDNRGVVSLDLPGGKRRLAETAWEAALRETVDECDLETGNEGHTYFGTDGTLEKKDHPTFAVQSWIDGQSVRFFLMTPAPQC